MVLTRWLRDGCSVGWGEAGGILALCLFDLASGGGGGLLIGFYSVFPFLAGLAFGWGGSVEGEAETETSLAAEGSGGGWKVVIFLSLKQPSLMTDRLY
jgi:hypothetical protein